MGKQTGKYASTGGFEPAYTDLYGNDYEHVEADPPAKKAMEEAWPVLAKRGLTFTREGVVVHDGLPGSGDFGRISYAANNPGILIVRGPNRRGRDENDHVFTDPHEAAQYLLKVSDVDDLDKGRYLCRSLTYFGSSLQADQVDGKLQICDRDRHLLGYVDVYVPYKKTDTIVEVYDVTHRRPFATHKWAGYVEEEVRQDFSKIAEKK